MPNLVNLIKSYEFLSVVGDSSNHDTIILCGFLVVSILLLIGVPVYCSLSKHEDDKVSASSEEIKLLKFVFPNNKDSQKKIFQYSNLTKSKSSSCNEESTDGNKSGSLPESSSEKLDRQCEKLFGLLVPEKVKKTYDSN
ncbi:unnamed protein product [Moneuplotes crassus]|uniref:Uncharacterized protein n=1 Tax=Euplotes crassus TaxID=5936 RepID=A0AAD1U3S5_EUPCR|nr:unnamed protein product [Moneuplotes crassus]